MTENNSATAFRPGPGGSGAPGAGPAFGTGTSFGRVFGEGARKLTMLHRQAIAESGSDFPTWMLLTLLSEQQSAITVETVIAEMQRRMDLARPNTISLLENTAELGFTDSTAAADAAEPTVQITPAGSKFFADMYTHSRKTTDAALAGIDPKEVETAINVMLAVDANATRLLG